MSWFGLVVLGVVVAITEAVAAGLIYGLVRAAAEDLPLAEVFSGAIMSRLPGFEALTTAGLVGVLAAFFVFRAVLTGVQAFLGNRAVFGTAVATSEELMARYMDQDYEFHVQRGSAELMRNVRDSVDVVSHHILVPLIRAGSEILVAVGLVIALLILAPSATLVLIGGLGLVGVVTFLAIRRILQPLGRQSHDAAAASLKSAQELFRGIRDVKLLESDEFVRQPFSQAQTVWGRANYWRSTVHTVPRLVAETTLAITVLLVLLSGSTVGSADSVSALALVGLFGYAAIRLVPAIAYMFTALNGLHFGAPALLAIESDLQQLGTPSGPVVVADSRPMGARRAGSDIRFVGVWHSYTGSKDPVIRDLNLMIKRGEHLGIIGPSGSGKSTLVDLLAGLLVPSSGQILVDGSDVHSLKDWRRTLGVVSQAPFIADDTIRRNIAFGVPDSDIDHDRVQELAELMDVNSFAVAERGGLDMDVGELGVELSGGERQRIALARSLYRRPEVLILDEATSALDGATEAKVLQGVSSQMRNKTVVIVAHRPSAIRSADRLVMLVSGSIAASGSYRDVANTSEYAYLMVASPTEDRDTPVN